VLFVYRQFAAPQPVAEWRLFRIRSYAAATSYVLLSNLIMYTTILAVPFFVEEVQKKGSLTSGTLLGAVSLPATVLSPLGGRLSDSLGRRPLSVAGSFVLLAGVLALLAGIKEDASVAFLAPVLALFGVGLGLSVGPTSAAAIECAPRELAGAAAGTNSMMRYVGSIIGAGILGSVLSNDAAAPGVGVFRLIFVVLLVISVLATIAAVFIHRFPPEEHDTRAQDAAGEVPAAAEIAAAGN